MRVSLISRTPDAEKTIMYCARVSNPLGQDSTNTRLINYCIQHNHWSIFEMANMVIEIETNRAISAQILRHRSFSFQEFSQRYAQVDGAEMYMARRQDEKNRQNSIDDLPEGTQHWFWAMQNEVNEKAFALYEEAVEAGIAKEVARALLPMSSRTRIYMNGTLRSWMHYIDLRTEEGTQKEHRDIAEAVKQVFCEEFPIIAEAKGWI